jgi:hypothetical protein|nr:hypothetical protein [Kofleriaceae bacterium]
MEDFVRDRADRMSLFAREPVPELRGLASLTDPGDDVAAVIDLAVMGARGDGKTQFLVHAIRALHGRAPALAGTEAELNRAVMRLVLDPRAPRPDATPPGVLPHFTFRARPETLYAQLGWRGSWLLASRIGRVGRWLVLAYALVAAGVAVAIARDPARGVVVAAIGAAMAAIASLVARRRIARSGEIEIVFWDVAGEQIYSQTAADYHALLAELVAQRRRRADELGRAYAYAPVLICNPLALGTLDGAPPFARLRELLPLFAAIDREATTALIAINRWSVVDRICARGAQRDEVVRVTTCARDEADQPAQRVARERVRAECLDAEDGRRGDVLVRYVRYDTALHCTVGDVARDGDGDGDGHASGEPELRYEYDDGPGTFSGDARRRFLDWLVAVPRWRPTRRRRPATAREADAREPADAHREFAPTPGLTTDVWGRPQ